jgi:hypothetical protein
LFGAINLIFSASFGAALAMCNRYSSSPQALESEAKICLAEIESFDAPKAFVDNSMSNPT